MQLYTIALLSAGANPAFFHQIGYRTCISCGNQAWPVVLSRLYIPDAYSTASGQFTMELYPWSGSGSEATFVVAFSGLLPQAMYVVVAVGPS